MNRRLWLSKCLGDTIDSYSNNNRIIELHNDYITLLDDHLPNISKSSSMDPLGLDNNDDPLSNIRDSEGNDNDDYNNDDNNDVDCSSASSWKRFYKANELLNEIKVRRGIGARMETGLERRAKRQQNVVLLYLSSRKESLACTYRKPL